MAVRYSSGIGDVHEPTIFMTGTEQRCHKMAHACSREEVDKTAVLRDLSNARSFYPVTGKPQVFITAEY